jgi:ribosome maturation factor RimP
MSSLEQIKEKVMGLANEATAILNVELFDVELKGQRGRMMLRVIIDRDTGVSIKDCEAVSRQLTALLDIEDPIPGSYTLEVTSPGLDRPLRTKEEFEKYLGKKVRVTSKKKIADQAFFVGHIFSVGDDRIVLQLEKKIVEIPYADITKARLEIDF